MTVIEAHEAHSALVDLFLEHYDEHAATNTGIGDCCDAYATAEQQAWMALLEAEAEAAGSPAGLTEPCDEARRIGGR